MLEFGDWRDDVVKAGIPLHELGRFSYPVCPVHGWIAIKKKKFNVWSCKKCSFEAKIDEKYYRQWRKEQEEKRLSNVPDTSYKKKENDSLEEKADMDITDL